MFRENIEAERGRLGLTKTQMSEELGVTLKTYGVYIDGGPIPSDKLERLRELTGRTIDYLLGVEGYVKKEEAS